MDNKEAISVIRSNWPPSNYTMLIEALEIAIKSLEASESAQTAHNSIKAEISALMQALSMYPDDKLFTNGSVQKWLRILSAI